MLKQLRKLVCAANLKLPRYGLVSFTWGNVSGIDRDRELMVIKPSGVPYKELTYEDMVIVDMDGNVVEGEAPSQDTATHLRLYKAFPGIGGIVHTHSTWATIFAQAGLAIPAYGTTHADYFHGAIPCTRALTEKEIGKNYEKETGNVIAEAFDSLDPMSIPGVLVKNHGPFAWGVTPVSAVHNAVVLEQVAQMAYHTRVLKGQPMPQALLDKHFHRKNSL